ncbi:MAG: acetyl-coenzyme A synthetase, partial [Methanobacterium sp.]|nr:acetyl-coenzyme A synthetase [Methanobacterium sp.]
MLKATSVLLDERRIFKPNYELVEEAHIKNWEAELEKGKDLEKYWAEKSEQFEWFKPWDKVL